MEAVFVVIVAAAMELFPTTQSAAQADEIMAGAVCLNTGCVVCIVTVDDGKTMSVVYQCS